MLIALTAIAALALWLRAKGIPLWPRRSSRPRRRLELLDRLALTHQHSLHLIATEGRWLCLAVTPKGVEMLDSGELQESAAESLPDGSGFDSIFAQALAKRKAGKTSKLAKPAGAA